MRAIANTICFLKLMSEESSTPPIEVPIEALSAELLDAIIESFILREGTDYGSVEFSLEAKLKQVRRQIEKGDVKIVFDPTTESVNLMTDRDFKKHSLEFVDQL